MKNRAGEVKWCYGEEDTRCLTQETIGSSFKRIPYDYFNLNDQLIEKEHKADTPLPSCSSMKYNYFKVNKTTFWLKNQALAYVEKALQAGCIEFYFRLESRIIASDVEEKIYNLIYSYLSKQGIVGKRVKRITNDKIGTCIKKLDCDLLWNFLIRN